MARIAIGRYLWKKSVWVALGLPRCCKMRRLLWLIRLEYQGWYFEKTKEAFLWDSGMVLKPGSRPTRHPLALIDPIGLAISR